MCVDVTLLNFIYLVFLACLGSMNIVCDSFLSVVFRVCVCVCVCVRARVRAQSSLLQLDLVVSLCRRSFIL